MAHVAKIENGRVASVFVIDNSDLPNNGEFSQEVEQAANDHMNNIGEPGLYKLTSYNNNFRGKFAGIGNYYDEENDIFVTHSDDYEAQVLAEQLKNAQQALINEGYTPEEVERISGYPYNP